MVNCSILFIQQKNLYCCLSPSGGVLEVTDERDIKKYHYTIEIVQGKEVVWCDEWFLAHAPDSLGSIRSYASRGRYINAPSLRYLFDNFSY